MIPWLKRVALLVLVPCAIGQAALVCSASGCGSALRAFDEVNDPADDKALRDCRNAGRAALEAGASNYRAFDVYDDCTKEAGF